MTTESTTTSRTLAARFMAGLKHVGDLALAHAAFEALIGATMLTLSWLTLHSGAIAIGVGLAALVWAAALGAFAPTRSRRLTVRIAIVASAGIASIVAGTALLAANVPAPAYCVMPHEALKKLRAFRSSNAFNADALIEDMLVELHTYLDRNHHPASLRVEFAEFDSQVQGLRLLTRHSTLGWVSSVQDRVYAVPGKTPGGKSSIAGKAYVTRTEQFEAVGNACKDFCIFNDDADHRVGATVTVYSVPCMLDSQGEPWGVLSITSPAQTSFSDVEKDLIREYAGSLAEFRAHHKTISHP